MSEILGYCLKHTNCDNGMPIIVMVNRLLFDKGDYTPEVQYIVDLVEQRLLHPERGDNGFLEELFGDKDEAKTAYPQDAAVDKCFRFPSEFTREKVKSVVDLYYQDSYANLALIEIALYDHHQLKYRNHHKAFVKALVAWDIIKVENDDEFDLILFGIKDKYKRLSKAGPYLGWGAELSYEKDTCISIGEELGETTPYRYKKER